MREDAAYRAGMVEARLGALDAHAAVVNGSIKATADALSTLTLSVNELRLTIKLLEIGDLTLRVVELEKSGTAAAQLTTYRRWLVGTSLALAAVLVALVSSFTLIH